VSAKSDFFQLPGLRVTLDSLIYRFEEVTSPERPHCFIYFITIHNDSDIPVTIRGRKWVVKNGDGEVLVVEGDGVVGKTPRIAPGESFSYNSCHLLDTEEGVAEGAYFGIDESGRRIMTRIPTFRMIVVRGDPPR
jgi:ApaG protein